MSQCLFVVSNPFHKPENGGRGGAFPQPGEFKIAHESKFGWSGLLMVLLVSLTETRKDEISLKE